MKGCLIAAGIVCLLVAALGYGVYSAFDDFPERAESRVLIPRYQDSIDQVTHAVESHSTLLTIAAALEQSQWPDELIYLSIQSADVTSDGEFDDETIDVIKRIRFSSHSSTLINGAGYGMLGEQPVLIVALDFEHKPITQVRLYFVDDQV